MTETDPLAAVEAAAFAILAADPNALANGKSFAARLGDRAPGAKRESRILAQAIADGAGPIRTASGDRQIVRAQLAARLENEHGYRADLAQWAISLLDRLIHGGPPAAAPAPVAVPAASRSAAPMEPSAFVQAAPSDSAVAAMPQSAGVPSVLKASSLAGWAWFAVLAAGCGLAFGIATNDIHIYAVATSYPLDADAKADQAFAMLGYAATIGAPFGLVTGKGQLGQVVAAFLAAFAFLAIQVGVDAAIGRLIVLLPCAVFAAASAFAVRQFGMRLTGMAAVALGASLATGLHMVIGSLLLLEQTPGAPAHVNGLAAAFGVAGAAVCAAVGAYLNRFAGGSSALAPR